ncbi:zinc ribbon domain-containing protein [Paenibacillus spiritus]|uniref:Zinc ribbon domain-containing protein n=1 Tax=Paenibacillus spiritus TaxID=2496557 RepID=A0A5J5FWJ2_9BACL|nr:MULTISPECIES: zinc ribbon domain-containing protein [Paenibacillus]KAA8997231.1 zinc ribbon domain-containing protein [Paenibacillus spiritus]
MNLLQRLKDGANRVSEKATNSVEIGKLNSRIAEIEREMDMEFLRMGRIFYEGYRGRDLTLAEGRMTELARTCSKHQEKIDDLRVRIAELKNERLCACGYVASMDARFCPQCGRKLESAAPAPAPEAPEYPAGGGSAAAGRDAAVIPEEGRVLHADDLPVIRKEAPAPQERGTDDYGDEAYGDEAYGEQPDFEDYALHEGGDERERRLAEELERERERQLELDRRIREWKSGGGYTEADDDGEPAGRDMVKCQICRADLPKGSMWCPRCGSEQI